MMINRAYWLVSKKLLFDYTSGNKSIKRFYLRHSSAVGPQDPFLSDFDTAIFVKAGDFAEFKESRGILKASIDSDPVVRRLIKDPIILPETENTYDLCRKYYPFRSVYPFETWRLLSDKIKPRLVKHDDSLPLDHAPENAIFHYILPAMRPGAKRHIFEKQFLSRKIKKDSALIGVDVPKRPNSTLCGALLSEIDIWASFYGKLDFPANEVGQVIKEDIGIGYGVFLNRWKAASGRLKDPDVIASVWVYPNWMNCNTANIVVNLCEGVSEEDCQEVVGSVGRVFKDLSFNLFIGREDSMIGRINGLFRLNLLDPWLFSRYGTCLSGDQDLKEKIADPGMDALKKKHMELMLYFAYSAIHNKTYPYIYYKVSFILDNFFKAREIVLSDDGLSRIYGPEFIPKNRFDPAVHTSLLLASLKKMHGFSLF